MAGWDAAADRASGGGRRARERAAWEREMLGMLVSVHALDLVADALARYPLVSSADLAAHAGRDVWLAGVPFGGQRFCARRAGRSEPHAPRLLLDLRRPGGAYQVLWNPALESRYRRVFRRGHAVVVKGRVRQDRQGLIVVVGEEAAALTSQEVKRGD
jgi:hypothetical protein